MTVRTSDDGGSSWTDGVLLHAGPSAYSCLIELADGDVGATWTIGGTTPSDQVNECAVAELDDGTLLLNMRNYDRSQRSRAQCRSADGGATWSEVTHNDQLPEPICQASMISLDGGRRLAFSNPASSSQRVRMTVRGSLDDGFDWSDGILLHEGPAAYSSLVGLDEDSVGCLYECGTAHPYERIRYARVDS